MELLNGFLSKVHKLNKNEFLALYSNSFLISSLSNLNIEMDSAIYRYQQRNQQNKPTTEAITDLEDTKLEQAWAKQGWITPVKSKRGGQIQMINIGRTADNDIILPLASISKLHACIILVQNQGTYILDGGSTNGTFIGSERVSSHKQLIRSGDVIRFGHIIEFEYYEPADLYNLVPLFYKLTSRSKTV